MAAAGIISSGFSSYGDALSEAQQLVAEFNQLGTDLHAGNLSAAQSDFAMLNEDAATFTPSAGAQGNSPLDQEFQKLAQDLQGGNLSAAQQDFAAIQQDLQGGGTTNTATPGPSPVVTSGPASPGTTAPGGTQNAVQGQNDTTDSQGTQGHWHHHGHHHGHGSDSGNGGGEIAQLMGQLGQALESGNLGAAQQAYTSLSQDWTNHGQNGEGGQSNSQNTPNSGPTTPSPTPAGTTSESETLVYVNVDINITA